MIGLALEGGGAKGAFHVGAVKALLDNGYEFNGVVGTSIGAFNGAMICQGDFQKLYDIWMDMEPSLLFNVENENMQRLVKDGITKENLKYLSSKGKGIIGNRGVNTTRLRKVLDDNIDEIKIRESSMDFGIVTISLSELKGVEVYKDEIPKDRLKDYIMASANYPGFKIAPIDGKYYIDGGMHDNCPINLLVRKGYNEIIAVRTSNSEKSVKCIVGEANITNIIPSEDLGMAFVFDNNLLRRNIKLGYYDSLRVIKNLKGKKYYIEPSDDTIFFNIINNIPDNVILRIGETLKISPMHSKRMVFEKIIPTIADLLKLPNSATYQDIFIGLLEVLAKKENIEKYKVYDINGFIECIQKSTKYECADEKRRRHLLDLKRIATGILGANMLDELANVILDTVHKDTFKK